MSAKVLSAISLAVLLGACATKVPVTEAPPVTAIGNQKLTSNFTRKGIKVEFECGYFTNKNNCHNGEFQSIEVTAVATSNGNSENNREDAFKVAELKAKAKLRKFIREDVNTSEVTHVLTKNVEKANDKIKSKIASNEDVSVTDTEVDKEDKDANTAVRENPNDIARTVTEDIRVQANGILKGVYVLDEKIVDRQTVQVTIRWDKQSEKASEYFNSKFK